ncbi:hypothetical protein [Acinetobacter lwoffii]|uniref:hypothetical protein n=1 Tax=Acinetobacter lwoffii TaxID=28090 RepID=UPI001FF0E63C|nr:hypothetical protein [Acinetobacter lwoffii]MCJ8512259.1 hypothetical protein [Acinetobacter lwoffii]
MKINKSIVFATLYSIIAFFFTIIVMPFFTNGDQSHYRDFYRYCFYDAYTLEQQFFCFQNTLGSSEPGYFVLSKIFNSISISKDIFIAIANTILTFISTILIFRYYKAVWHRHLFLLLVLSNYYFIVMLFSAERLKFGFIFLVLGLLYANRSRIALFILAILTHAQVAIMIAPLYLSRIFAKETRWPTKLVVSLGGLVLFGGMFYFLQGHIQAKYSAYSTLESGSIGIMGALKTAVFIVFAAISIRKSIAIIAGLPIIILAYFLGSDRIGMLAFILYVGLVLYYKNKMDLMLLIVMLYFSYKSIEFISNIFIYGNGYNFS